MPSCPQHDTEKTIVLTARENRSIPTLHILALNSQPGHLLLIPHALRKCPNGRAGVTANEFRDVIDVHRAIGLALLGSYQGQPEIVQVI